MNSPILLKGKWVGRGEHGLGKCYFSATDKTVTSEPVNLVIGATWRQIQSKYKTNKYRANITPND